MVDECDDGEWVGAPQRCSNNPEKHVRFICACQDQGATSGGNTFSHLSLTRLQSFCAETLI